MLPMPLRSSTARPIMNVIQMLALSFLDNTVPNVVSNINTRKLEIKSPRSRFWSKKPQRRLVGNGPRRRRVAGLVAGHLAVANLYCHGWKLRFRSRAVPVGEITGAARLLAGILETV